MKLFFIFIVFTTQAFAYSLKNLAQTSNIIFVLSERLNSDAAPSVKTCGLSNSDIARIIEKFKVEVDAKIITMEDSDFKIVQNRIKNCEQDCSCNIYSLALEKKEMMTPELEKKSSEITIKDRIRCLSQVQNICDNKILKDLR